MSYILSTCPYCKIPKSIAATRTNWMIHLHGHRENIIKDLTDNTSSCVFCAYSEIFANKKHASSHYRWSHKKTDLVRWTLENMKKIVVV
ncbi:hypothetical protein [Nitrosopumilus sp.]|uniref:hypothetical protein n=1 Tax=Nitrosopumilus sp. TaxID=2024843 RepID=UPI00247E0814|nr:hypothetical protein [Nitrosopumilus sp.]MCV0431810.1 hypothetical protein [Nitrosopumilus sp.]